MCVLSRDVLGGQDVLLRDAPGQPEEAASAMVRISISNGGWKFGSVVSISNIMRASPAAG